MNPIGPALWLVATHESVHGSGGWAFARRVDGLVAGAAGGDRLSTPRRMALTALAEGLNDLPSLVGSATAAPVTLHTALADAGEILAVIAGKAAAPEADLDLWAPVLAAKGSRALILKAAPTGRDTPIAFLTAWAELTREKAMARRQFRAVLPRSNLENVRWV